MIIYPSELEHYKHFKNQQDFNELIQTDDQKRMIRDFSQKKEVILKKYFWLHNLLNISLLFALFFFDYLLLQKIAINGISIFNFIVLGFWHGFFIYSITIFTIHEGAAHQRIILGQGFLIDKLKVVVNNLSRFVFADPHYYVGTHFNHHRYFGTEKDGAYTLYVDPWRIFKSFIPGAAFFPFCDYKIHADDRMSKSKLVTLFLSLIYHVFIMYSLLKTLQGVGFFLLFLVFSGWIAFSLDRIRESTEHQLMSDQNSIGARNFGLSFFGLLIGGGPWGQPCHHSHHLAPNLVWYQQIQLHYKLKKIYNLKQKSFLLHDRQFSIPKLIKKIRMDKKSFS